jgi:hypothetical protein
MTPVDVFSSISVSIRTMTCTVALLMLPTLPDELRTNLALRSFAFSWGRVGCASKLCGPVVLLLSFLSLSRLAGRVFSPRCNPSATVWCLEIVPAYCLPRHRLCLLDSYVCPNCRARGRMVAAVGRFGGSRSGGGISGRSGSRLRMSDDCLMNVSTKYRG